MGRRLPIDVDTARELYRAVAAARRAVTDGDLLLAEAVLNDLSSDLHAVAPGELDPFLPLGYGDLPEAEKARLDRAAREAERRHAVDMLARRREQFADWVELRQVA